MQDPTQVNESVAVIDLYKGINEVVGTKLIGVNAFSELALTDVGLPIFVQSKELLPMISVPNYFNGNQIDAIHSLIDDARVIGFLTGAARSVTFRTLGGKHASVEIVGYAAAENLTFDAYHQAYKQMQIHPGALCPQSVQDAPNAIWLFVEDQSKPRSIYIKGACPLTVLSPGVCATGSFYFSDVAEKSVLICPSYPNGWVGHTRNGTTLLTGTTEYHSWIL